MDVSTNIRLRNLESKALRACRYSVIVAAVAAVLVSQTAQANTVGIRVLAQEWNSSTPAQQSVHVLTEQPSAVSDALINGWNMARGSICGAIKQEMGRSKAAAGQTLRDIDCRLDQNIRVDVAPGAGNVLTATISVDKMYLAATTTVPNPFNFDPRFSLDVSGQLKITLAIQADPNHTLRAVNAVFSLSNANLDSQNASGDVAKWFVNDFLPFFGGPNFKGMAENAIDSVSLNITDKINQGLDSVNTLLRTPLGMVREHVWSKPDRISVAFMPAEIKPPTNAAMTGVVRWDGTSYTPRSGCSSIHMTASVQTGPAPLLDPDNWNDVGIAPTRNIGALSLNPVSNTQCSFTIAGLANGWPTAILASLQDGGSTGTGLHGSNYSLSPDGWTGPVIPNANGRNYKIGQRLVGTDTPARNYALTIPGDPALRRGLASHTTVSTPSEAMNRAPVSTAPINHAAQAGDQLLSNGATNITHPMMNATRGVGTSAVSTTSPQRPLTQQSTMQHGLVPNAAMGTASRSIGSASGDTLSAPPSSLQH